MRRKIDCLVTASVFALAFLFCRDGHLDAGLEIPILCILAGATVLFRCLHRTDGRSLRLEADTYLNTDTVSCLITDKRGNIHYENAASLLKIGSMAGEGIHRVLETYYADADAVFNDLSEKAFEQGVAENEIRHAEGRQNLKVMRLRDRFLLWRLEPVLSAEDAAEILDVPMICVDEEGNILNLSSRAQQLLSGRPNNVSEFLIDPLRRGTVGAILDGKAVTMLVVPGQKRRLGRDYAFFPVPFSPGTSSTQSVFFETLPVALMKVGKNGQIEIANQLARDLLALLPGRQNLADVVEGLGRPVQEWIDQVIARPGGSCSEVLRTRWSVEETYLQITLCRLPDPNDEAAIAVLHDATELKRLEAQFNQSQKMQAIGELAGGVAHDFNNLLTAISGHCDLLLLRRDPGNPDYGDLMQIHQNANRAASLVEQLLAFSRKQTLRPQAVDLRDSLMDIAHLLDRLVGAKIRLSVHHDSALAPIWVDRRQFEQVIMNLVVNARDAMPDGGEIQISTSVRRLVHDLKRDRAVVPAGEYVVVTVEDQGIGIASQQLDKIFDPFFTTKAPGKGTGLGLSMVYGIVKQSGGFIFVDKTDAKGTRFVLYFPSRRDAKKDVRADDRNFVVQATVPDGGELAVAASIQQVAIRDGTTERETSDLIVKPSGAEGTTGGRTILLVEDDRDLAATVVDYLELIGLRCDHAANGAQGLQLLSENRYDVLLLDLNLPRVDGLTVCRTLREQGAGYSGADADGARSAAGQTGRL